MIPESNTPQLSHPRRDPDGPTANLNWLHWPLAALGTYNLLKLLKYHIVAWNSLHDQGMGHFYLVIMTIAGSWWLCLACGLCFWGNIFLRNDAIVPNGRSVVRVVLFVALGAGLSLVVPPLMHQGFFIVITWIRTFL